MTARLVPGSLLLRAALLAASACGGAAHATTTTQYQCQGYRMLATEITPKEAQLHFEGNDWSLKRVHDNGEARYTSARANVTIITKGRELALYHAGQRLECKLVSDALGPKKPPPPAGDALPSAPAAGGK
jgi:hypothetical protein